MAATNYIKYIKRKDYFWNDIEEKSDNKTAHNSLLSPTSSLQ